MLFSFKAIKLDNINNAFTIGSPAARVRDPFCSSSGFLGHRLLNEDSHFPILFAESSSNSTSRLLFFISKNDDRIITWEVTTQADDTVKQTRQIQCSRIELALLLTLTDNSAQECRECIHQSISKAPRWVQNTSKNFINLLHVTKATDPSTTRSSRALTNIAFRDYINISNSASDSLLELIDRDVSGIKKELLQLYFEAYNDQLGKSFRPSFYEVARYCALRELYTFVTGEYVTIDPLTGQHTRSYSSRSWRTVDGFTSRLIKYKSSLGPTFVERRGPAWLDVTSQVLFSNGLVINIKTGQQWGSIYEDELRFIHDYLNHPDNDGCAPREIHLHIDLGGKNLGHLLWNELSGYIEFNLLAKKVGYVPTTFSSSLPPTQSNLFSKIGIRSHLQKYIMKAIDRFPLGESLLLDSSMPDMKALPMEKGGSKDRVSLVSFRYPRLSPYLVQAIKDDYPTPTSQIFKIYINVRSHNKCHSNLVECIDALLENIAGLETLKDCLVSLELEYFSEEDELAPKVSNLCNQKDFACNHHVGYEIPQLFELVSHSSICISPIGSGSISPTWIFNKPTVVHGDRRHMSQLKWWSEVGGSISQIFPIPTSAISDDYDKFYSNYKIDPKVYAEIVLDCIVSFCLSRS